MGATNQARTGSLSVVSAHGGDEFVFDEGESPAWIVTDDMGEQHAAGHALSALSSTHMPLTFIQYASPPNDLHEVRRRVAQLARADLIQRYRTAFSEGKRLVAGIMAAELIERGIPPCFWHDTLALHDPSLDQRADLVLTDLAWLRRRYPEHVNAVRYRRGRAIIAGSEAVFRREAEFAFYQGKRPAWKLVGSMSMTERQQWDSAYLRSTPVKRCAEVIEALSTRVHQALADDLQAVCRTTEFTDADADASLARRYALWRCRAMVKNASPTEIAVRYQQMTGMTITRQAVAKQLLKVRAVLKAKCDDPQV
jgi:hypothetical protein